MTSSPGARALSVLALCCPIAVFACGPSRPSVVEVNLSATDSPSASSEPEAQEDPSRTLGCRWTDTKMHARDDALPLCFENRGACFAKTGSSFTGEVTVELPSGEPAKTGARLDLRADGIRLHASTDADQILFYPKEPVVLGEIAISKDASLVHVARLTDRILELRLRPEKAIVPSEGALSGRVSCSAVGIGRLWYSEEAIRSAIGGDQSPFGSRMLVPGRPLAISATPSGPVRATVTPEESDVRVELLAQSGGRSRILYWRGDLVIFGWVDTASLEPPPSEAPSGMGYGTGYGRLGGGKRPGTSCTVDIALFAEVHDARQEVGTIEKGTVFDVEDPPVEGGFMSVRLRTTQIHLEPSSAFLVKQADLKRCEEQ